MYTIILYHTISSNTLVWLCVLNKHLQTAQVKAPNMFNILFVSSPLKTSPAPSLWNLPNIIIFCLAALKRNHLENLYARVFLSHGRLVSAVYPAKRLRSVKGVIPCKCKNDIHATKARSWDWKRMKSCGVNTKISFLNFKNSFLKELEGKAMRRRCLYMKDLPYIRRVCAQNSHRKLILWF